MKTTARNSFATGDIDRALSEIRSLPDTSMDYLQLITTIDLLQGRHADAGAGLRQIVDESALHPLRRLRAQRTLSLVHFQSNQFEDGGRLPLRDPLTRLMRSFRSAPNIVTWKGDRRAVLPFLQQESWELPCVAVTANGEEMVARIDTGGDLFSVPWSVAKRIGVEPVATSTGWFAGGHRARTGRGILEHLDLGGVAIGPVPVSINSFDHPIVGTGLLRQFLSTLDYPAGELVLQPRQRDGSGSGFPFLMAGTHLMIASGSVNGVTAQLLVDSGLEVTNEGCFLAPESTLAAAGISIPRPSKVDGASGAGPTRLEIGEFVVDELRLGTETRHQVTGLTGIFPPQLAKSDTIGFPLDGLVSHNYLRHYRWTIDFDQMRMELAGT